jgi:hypothetical protein
LLATTVQFQVQTCRTFKSFHGRNFVFSEISAKVLVTRHTKI